MKKFLLAYSTLYLLSCAKLEREPLILNVGTSKDGNCYSYSMLIADKGEADRSTYGLVLYDEKIGEVQNIEIDVADEQVEAEYLFDSLAVQRKYLVWPFMVHNDDTLFDDPSSFNTNETSFLKSFSKDVVSSQQINFQLELENLCSFKGDKTGVCYSLKELPSIDDSTNLTTIDSTQYVFSVQGMPKGKKMNYRPCVLLKNGQVIYGDVIDHTHETISILTTGNTNSSQLPASIALEIEISTLGDDTVDQMGIVYSTTTNSPDYNESIKLIAIQNEIGKYFAIISNPVSSIKYYYRAFARVGNKIYYGEIKSFEI